MEKKMIWKKLQEKKEEKNVKNVATATWGYIDLVLHVIKIH